MGLYSHATHLFVPDKDQARQVVAALLRSPHSLVISTPYGNWLNVYLPLGLSYKDVPELLTTPHLELNCYDSEGFDVRLYQADRLAFHFESGCGDVSAEEDELLEIAEKLWREDPNRPVRRTTPIPATDDGEEAAEHIKAREPDFWDLDKEQQDRYIAMARKSGDFQKFVQRTTQSDENIPLVDILEPYLPEGRSLTDLHLLIAGASRRLYGPPSDEREQAVLERWMNGRNHSTQAEDYVAAVARFFELKGSLWSLEAIQQQKADKIDRRIVPVAELIEPPSK